jgi:hypothetical protein
MDHSHTYRVIEGRYVANEHSPIRGNWPFGTQVFGDRATGGEREWEGVGATALSLCYPDSPCLPIDVVQPHVNDLAGAQTQIREASNNGIAAPR